MATRCGTVRSRPAARRHPSSLRALAYAALEQMTPGPTTVAVVSGGNIDTALLASLLS